MSSSCRRPGCTKVAAVTIRYDPVSCQLWLDPIGTADSSTQTLCVEHAERLSPPRGWVVVDRRGVQTTIVSPHSVGLPTAPARRSARRPVRRRWGSFEAPTLEFTSEPVGDELPTPEADLVEPTAEPEPVLVEADPEVVAVADPEPDVEPDPPERPVDDLGDLLNPRGGLLGRAFESTGHQRSALTLSDPEEPAP